LEKKGMPEFLTLLPPDEAKAKWMASIQIKPGSEEIDTVLSLGRVTANPVYAPDPLPPFTRSSVDGFALIAADTHGASDSLPAYLQVIGEVMMGVPPNFNLLHGQSARIHTGGMLPHGADAVIMIEHTQIVQDGEVEVLRPVAYGENILRKGEDVAQGEEIIPSGIILRPAEIGGLMALGLTRVQVVRKPRVGIISTGDEVISPDTVQRPGQVRDINSYSLGALVEESGGLSVRFGIVPDDESKLRNVIADALGATEIVVVTAGSSASVRDITAKVINDLGEPGVIVHGVNVRPGKPTILAACTDPSTGINKAIIGLPGNPVSALVIARMFIVPLIDKWLGMKPPNIPELIKARLVVNLLSQTGREDWIPVRLRLGDELPEADPVFGKSNLIFSLVRADGLLRIPADATGLSAGEKVDVLLF
jgi:molybdopterin molybdotransferase